MGYTPIFLTGGWNQDRYDCLCKAIADTINARKAEVPLDHVYATVVEESFAQRTVFVEWNSDNVPERVATVSIEIQYLCRSFTQEVAFEELRIAVWRIAKIVRDDDEGLIRAGGCSWAGYRSSRTILADLEWALTQGQKGERYDGALITIDFAAGFAPR